MLTEAEKLELAQLEAEEQQSFDAVGALEQAGQGLSLGFQDEMRAGLQSVLPYGESYDQELSNVRAQQEAYKEANPKTAFGARLAGNVVTGIATGGLGGNMIAREAALGGIEGFGSGEGMEDRLTGAGYGAALGAGFSKLGDVFGSVFSRPSSSQRVVDGISEVSDRALRRAEAKTGKTLVTKATRLGSESGKTLENILEKAPLTGATGRIKNNLQTELNSAAARSIGAPDGKLTEDVLGETLDDIVEELAAPTAGQIMLVPEPVITNIQRIVDETKRLPSRPSKAISYGDNLIEELNSGVLTGERYKVLSEDVRKLMYSLRNSPDSVSRPALSQMNEALDDIVENTLGGQSLIDYKSARVRYGNFKSLTKGMNTIDANSGDVNGKLLFNELGKGGKAYTVGGELGDLARISKEANVIGSNTTEKLMPYIGGSALGIAGMTGGLDVSGTVVGGLVGARAVNELAQRGIPGVTAEGAGMLGGALSRARE